MTARRLGGAGWTGRILRFTAAHPLWVVAVILLSDLSMQYDDNYIARAALQDELAHGLTAALVLVLLCRSASLPFLRAALLASVLLDLDHIPLLLGLFHPPHGIDRPYTHSLALVLCALAAGLVLKRRRTVCQGIAFGLIAHLARDLVTGHVPLLWPLVPIGMVAPYPAYGLSLVAMGGVLVWRRRAIQRPRFGMGSVRNAERRSTNLG